MNKTVKGYINSIETFGAVDGPGVRFIVFLQGCRMRCRYCHNPETWEIPSKDTAAAAGASQAAVEAGAFLYPQDGTGVLHGSGADTISMTVSTPEEMWRQAKRYRPYWKNGGGVTVSGGEALLQIDWVTEFFRICKENGVHTALDTAGNPFTREEPFFSKFEALCAVTDLFILDIKQIDGEKHRSLTGFDNRNILEMAEYLSEHGKHMWIRHVLVPGIRADRGDLEKLRAFLDTLRTVDRVEVLPYHTMGIPKWEKLGIPYTLEGVKPPTAEEIRAAEEILGCRNG